MMKDNYHLCNGCFLPLGLRNSELYEIREWAKQFDRGLCYLIIFPHHLREFVYYHLGNWPKLEQVKEMMITVGMDMSYYLNVDCVEIDNEQLHIYFDFTKKTSVNRLLNYPGHYKIGGVKKMFMRVMSILSLVLLPNKYMAVQVLEEVIVNNIEKCFSSFVYASHNYMDCRYLCNKDMTLKRMYEEIEQLSIYIDDDKTKAPYIFYNVLRSHGVTGYEWKGLTLLRCNSLEDSIKEVLQAEGSIFFAGSRYVNSTNLNKGCLENVEYYKNCSKTYVNKYKESIRTVKRNMLDTKEVISNFTRDAKVMLGSVNSYYSDYKYTIQDFKKNEIYDIIFTDYNERWNNNKLTIYNASLPMEHLMKLENLIYMTFDIRKDDAIKIMLYFKKKSRECDGYAVMILEQKWNYVKLGISCLQIKELNYIYIKSDGFDVDKKNYIIQPPVEQEVLGFNYYLQKILGIINRAYNVYDCLHSLLIELIKGGCFLSILIIIFYFIKKLFEYYNIINRVRNAYNTIQVSERRFAAGYCYLKILPTADINVFRERLGPRPFTREVINELWILGFNNNTRFQNGVLEIRRNILHINYNFGSEFTMLDLIHYRDIRVGYELDEESYRISYIPSISIFYSGLFVIFRSLGKYILLDLYDEVYGAIIINSFLVFIIWRILPYFELWDISSIDIKNKKNIEGVSYNITNKVVIAQSFEEVHVVPTHYTDNLSDSNVNVTEVYKKKKLKISKYNTKENVEFLEKVSKMELSAELQSETPHPLNESIRMICNESIKSDVGDGKRVLVVGSNVTAWPVSGYYHSIPNLEPKDDQRVKQKLDYIENKRKQGINIEYSILPLQQIKLKFDCAIFVHSCYNIPFKELFYHCYRLRIKEIYITMHVSAEIFSKSEGVMVSQDLKWRKCINNMNEKVIEFIHYDQNEIAMYHDWDNYYKYLITEHVQINEQHSYNRISLKSMPDVEVFKYTLNRKIYSNSTMTLNDAQYRNYKRLNIYDVSIFCVDHGVAYISTIAYNQIREMLLKNKTLENATIINALTSIQRTWVDMNDYANISKIFNSTVNPDKIIDTIRYIVTVEAGKYEYYGLYGYYKMFENIFTLNFISSYGKRKIVDKILDIPNKLNIKLQTESLEYYCEDLEFLVNTEIVKKFYNRTIPRLIKTDKMNYINNIITEGVSFEHLLEIIYKDVNLITNGDSTYDFKKNFYDIYNNKTYIRYMIYSDRYIYTNCPEQSEDLDVALSYDYQDEKFYRHNLNTLVEAIKYFPSSIGVYDVSLPMGMLMARGAAKTLPRKSCFSALINMFGITLNENYNVNDIREMCTRMHFILVHNDICYKPEYFYEPRVIGVQELEDHIMNLNRKNKAYCYKSRYEFNQNNQYLSDNPSATSVIENNLFNTIDITHNLRKANYVFVLRNHCYLLQNPDLVEQYIDSFKSQSIDCWYDDIQGSRDRKKTLIDLNKRLNGYKINKYTEKIVEILKYTIHMELMLIEKYGQLQKKGIKYLKVLTDVYVYNNQKKEFINMIPPKKYNYGWNGIGYCRVVFDEKTNVYYISDNSKFILFSDEIEFIRERDILFNLSHQLDDIMLYNYSDIIFEIIEGVPGCGKTTYVKRHHNPCKDLVCTATRTALKDYKTINEYYRTYDSILINGSPVVENVYCDEYMMVHFGDILLTAFLSKAKKIICIGDSQQISFISRCIDFKFEKNKPVVDACRTLNVTYRSPKIMFKILKNFYNDIIVASKIQGDIKLINITGIVENVEADIIITFTQYEKHELLKYYKNVNTIHEVQGKTFNNVAIYRFKIQDNVIYSSRAHIVVSITRHTKNLCYYYIKEDLLFEILNNRFNDLKFEVQPKIFNCDNKICMQPMKVLKHIKLKLYKDESVVVEFTKPEIRSNVLQLDYFIPTHILLYEPSNIILFTEISLQNIIDCLFDRPNNIPLLKHENANYVKLMGNNVIFNYSKILKRYINVKNISYCKSKLITPQLPPLKNTLNDTLYAILSRNLNPPILHKIQPKGLAKEVAKNFMQTYIDNLKLKKALMRHRYDNAIYTHEWLRKHQEKYIKSILGNLDKNFDPNVFYCHVKPDVKAKLDNSHNKELPAGQVITAHPPKITAYYSGYFKCMATILEESLKDNWIIYEGLCIEELNGKINNILCNHREFKVLETDFSKFDKSQEHFCLKVQQYIMLYLGMPKNIVKAWGKCHMINKLVFDAGVYIQTQNQRRSGDIFTFMGNTIINMAAMAYVYNLENEIGGAFAGDDSIIFLNKSAILYDKSSQLADIFNLVAKIEAFDASIYFCSKFLIHHNNYWYFVYDPIKSIVRLGKNNIINKDHCEEYYISFKDNNKYIGNVFLYDKLVKAIVNRYKFKTKDPEVAIYYLFFGLNGLVNDKDRFFQLFNDNKDLWERKLEYKTEYRKPIFNENEFRYVDDFNI